MVEDSEFIEIRTFASPSEIWDLHGFKHDNGVNRSNYLRLKGDYWFPDEVHCCFLKENGNLCNEGHKWGFVAELADGSFTIVGNNCAITKFGADSKIKADRTKYLNEKRRRERLASLADLLEQKDENLLLLEHKELELLKLKRSVKAFREKLGAQTGQQLIEMAKTGSSAITVLAVSYREYVDDAGEERKERSAASARIGNLSGIRIFNDHLFASIQSGIHAIREAYLAAAQIQNDVKISDLERITSELNSVGRIVEMVADATKEIERFFANDLTLLCFMTPDKSDRYKTARAVLDSQGTDVGKEKAKEWLNEKERELREQLGADKLEIR